jgi:hypothetical protein
LSDFDLGADQGHRVSPHRNGAFAFFRHERILLDDELKMISRTSQRLAASVEEVKQQLKLYAGNLTPNPFFHASREGEPDKD